MIDVAKSHSIAACDLLAVLSRRGRNVPKFAEDTRLNENSCGRLGFRNGMWFLSGSGYFRLAFTA